jgi:hypothetical protein
VAGEPRLDLAQARRSRKLRIQQRHQLALRRQPPYPRIGAVSLNQPVELGPWNPLLQVMKHAILMPHGVRSAFVSDERRQRSNTSRINTVHFVHQIPTGQPWDKPGHDENSGGLILKE